VRYIWEAGKTGRVMHIERFTPSGDETMQALCGIACAFNRSINVPFVLGRRICRNCEKAAMVQNGGGEA
jgi:hypothetical protein